MLYKFLYRFFDTIMVRSSFPVVGKLANRIRVFFARRISKNISNNAFIEKGAYICKNVFVEQYGCVGIRCHLDQQVYIGKHTMVGPDVSFYTTNHIRDKDTKHFFGYSDPMPIHVGDYCWIGKGAIILAGVNIGENVTIGAGSVVTKDIPANCLAAGNPAVVKKYYE